MRKGSTQSCNSCAYYIFDEEYGEYICDVAMDEDDYIETSAKSSLLLSVLP